ncbi:hypothetical protein CXF96_10310 [Stenotrophomonas sp. Betaine-02u-21]|uniref:hypothetical protein n=1 Tax=unclassified Stenotrophomonas TaxID=196198 RepID=UPI000C330BBE|nr:MULTISPECIES: hypothetical protein [unclassified Stenotrophomonas]PKH73896.1 hypothetical protein CXF96_10310 [Stenotrophomonas sp. Betaine-02u-21]PKH76328.1 hypothetical protein CXF90_02000 [Stenotrophomonas sp. Betaine-02u-23]PKH96476.1 hypothetical protein CXG43_07925 [Stenotrophomonas sp. Bg11-02]
MSFVERISAPNPLTQPQPNPIKQAGFPLENLRNEEGMGRWSSLTSLASEMGSLQLQSVIDDDTGFARAHHRAPLDRIDPSDIHRGAANVSGAHVQSVRTTLAPLINELEARVSAASAKKGTGPLNVSPDLYTAEQVKEAGNKRAACARTVLGEMGVAPAAIQSVDSNRRSAGGRAIIDACRLLAMPEAHDTRTRGPTEALRAALATYIKKADGDYTGVYKAFGADAYPQLQKLAACVESSIAAIGRDRVEQRLLIDMAPAMLDVASRKYPGLCASQLAQMLPEMMNPQAFSALLSKLENCSGTQLLHMIEESLQFLDPIKQPDRQPPAQKPVSRPATPADPLDQLERIVGMFKGVFPPIINNVSNIGNNNGNNNGNHVERLNYGRNRSRDDVVRLASIEEPVARVPAPTQRSQAEQALQVFAEEADTLDIGNTTLQPIPIEDAEKQSTAQPAKEETDEQIHRKKLAQVIEQLKKVQADGSATANLKRVTQELNQVRKPTASTVGDDQGAGDQGRAGSSAAHSELIMAPDAGRSYYMDRPNPYMMGAIPPGANARSRFRFGAENLRNNVSKDGNDGAEAQQNEVVGADGERKAELVKLAAPSRSGGVVRNRFGEEFHAALTKILAREEPR